MLARLEHPRAGRTARRRIGIVVMAATVLLGATTSGVHAATIALDGAPSESCSVRDDGRVVCGGWNDYQRGTGIAYNGSNWGPFVAEGLTAVRGISDAVSVAASGNLSCALHAKGTISCWGSGYRGALGDGELGPHIAWEPVPVPDITGATDLATSYEHACAVLAAGRLACWGSDVSGQAGGHAAAPGVAQPLTVAGLPAITDVATVVGRTCAVAVAGTVWCWGRDFDGELGTDRVGLSQHDTGSYVEDWAPAPLQVPGIADAKAIDSEGNKTCVVRATGAVVCWGRYWAEGQPTPEERFAGLYRKPTPVNDIADATSVAIGGAGACALRSGGGVKCWGDGRWGQLGITTGRSASAVSVRGVNRATAVAASLYTACAILAGGTTTCWGHNVAKGAADPAEALTYADTPVKALGITSAVALAQRDWNWCALAAAGTVTCNQTLAARWDQEEHPGEDVSGATPRVLGGLSDATAISTNYGMLCAIRSTHEVSCAGGLALERGETLRFSIEDRLVVAGTADPLVDVTQLSSGVHHTCALRTDGHVFCWGVGTYGEIGRWPGVFVTEARAFPIGGLTDATQIALAEHRSCALRAGGSVVCWGAGLGPNDLSGYGTDTPAPVPVSVPGTATAIDSDGRRVCVTLATGSEHCLFEESPTPPGIDLKCALVTGAIWCRGDGRGGALGVGNERLTSFRSVPVVQSDAFTTVTVPPSTPAPASPTPTPPLATPTPALTPAPEPKAKTPPVADRTTTFITKSARLRGSGVKIRATFQPVAGKECPRKAGVAVTNGKRTLRRASVRVTRAAAGFCVAAGTVPLSRSQRRDAHKLAIKVSASGGNIFLPIRT